MGGLKLCFASVIVLSSWVSLYYTNIPHFSPLNFACIADIGRIQTLHLFPFLAALLQCVNNTLWFFSTLCPAPLSRNNPLYMLQSLVQYHKQYFTDSSLITSYRHLTDHHENVKASMLSLSVSDNQNIEVPRSLVNMEIDHVRHSNAELHRTPSRHVYKTLLQGHIGSPSTAHIHSHPLPQASVYSVTYFERSGIVSLTNLRL